MTHGRFFRFPPPPARRVGLRARAAAIVVSSGLLSAAPAAAQATRSFDLSWQAPPPCPTSGEVEREIARLIGEGSRNRGTVRAFAEVTRTNEDWRVQIRIQDGARTSERTFDGATCRAVAKVASLIIALAIEPNAGNAPDVAPPPPREKPERPPSQPPSAGEAPLRGFVAAGPIAALRLLPNIGFGLEIALGLRLPDLSFELHGSALLPEPIDVPSLAAGGRFYLGSAGAHICARIVRGAPEIFGCAAGIFDIVHADGYGVTAPGSATALLGSAALGPRVDFPLSDAMRLSLAVQGTHTFSEASFRLDNVGNVHRTPRWGGSAHAHIGWFF
ncbi:MAG TPA: hypothetical protein VK540_04365 [Polyangiaceae bacterium]|nr:hypothetical protein [Polyangiaceae bacterium]